MLAIFMIYESLQTAACEEVNLENTRIYKCIAKYAFIRNVL